MSQQNAKARQERLLYYIQNSEPYRLDILTAFYDLTSSGIRKFHRDLDVLRNSYEIEQNSEGQYRLVGEKTYSILSKILTKDEQKLLERIQQEFQPGHPYAADMQFLLDKLAGRFHTQQQKLAIATPASYFGPRFARDYSLYRSTIEKLEQAISLMQCIRFTYTRPVSRELENVEHYEVAPQNIGVKNGVFYLYGYNTGLQKGYDFRIDKIKDLRVLAKKFGAFRNPADVIEFEYILDKSVVKGGISERFDQQELVEQLPDGRARVRATGRAFWIKQELLRMGKSVVVVSPDWLRAELAAEIAIMHCFYQQSN